MEACMAPGPTFPFPWACLIIILLHHDHFARPHSSYWLIFVNSLLVRLLYILAQIQTFVRPMAVLQVVCIKPFFLVKSILRTV
ncbi:hypothetical protein V8E52_003774 [Russula decolorans]